MRVPKLHRIKPKDRTRKPYFKAMFNGRPRHYGTDPAEAHRRYGNDLSEYLAGKEPGEPTSVAGIIDQWMTMHPSEHHKSLSHPLLRAVKDDSNDDIDDEYLATLANRMKRLRYVREKAKVKTPKPYSRKTIRDACAMARAILSFIAETGCRPSKACELRWDPIDITFFWFMHRRNKIEYTERVSSNNGHMEQLLMGASNAAFMRVFRYVLIERISGWLFVLVFAPLCLTLRTGSRVKDVLARIIRSSAEMVASEAGKNFRIPMPA